MAELSQHATGVNYITLSVLNYFVQKTNGTCIAMKESVLASLVLISPLLVMGCGVCPETLDRSETLIDGVCNQDVYSAVVLDATCNCILPENRYDCRSYYVDDHDSTVGDSYVSEVVSRYTCSNIQSYGGVDVFRTCMEVEGALKPGKRVVVVGGAGTASRVVSYNYISCRPRDNTAKQ